MYSLSMVARASSSSKIGAYGVRFGAAATHEVHHTPPLPVVGTLQSSAARAAGTELAGTMAAAGNRQWQQREWQPRLPVALLRRQGAASDCGRWRHRRRTVASSRCSFRNRPKKLKTKTMRRAKIHAEKAATLLRSSFRALSSAAARESTHSQTSQMEKAPIFDTTSMNTRVLGAAYAVRGSILDEAIRLKERLKAGEKMPFKELVPCNIGNPHSLGQQPLTFIRQVLSLCLNPTQLQSVNSDSPMDAMDRARRYVDSEPDGGGGMGAYTGSQGLEAVREEVAAFLRDRDGYDADASRIFLTNGASEGVRLVMQCLLRDPSDGFADGVLTPIPQYPLYSALLRLMGGALVPYYLDEARDWGVPAEGLRASLNAAKARGVCVRAVVVINPGNPTGTVLEESDIRSIIELAVEERLVVLADEVYQENVWDGKRRFVSFKKVACDMGYTAEDGDSRLHLVSFHSTSKGFLGECGLRGGFFELHGVSDGVAAQLLKLCSISLCSNTVGQVSTGLMVNPPRQDDPSGPLYVQERDAILSSLRRRSYRLSEALRGMEGVTCAAPQGALYAFPRITLGPRAVAAAAAADVAPDEYYCLWLLRRTGIMLVPGSGFGQRDGTWHFRTTFLPPEASFGRIVAAVAETHQNFMDAHRD